MHYKRGEQKRRSNKTGKTQQEKIPNQRGKYELFGLQSLYEAHKIRMHILSLKLGLIVATVSTLIAYLAKLKHLFLAASAMRLPSRVLTMRSLSWPLLSGGLFSLLQPRTLQGYPLSIAKLLHYLSLYQPISVAGGENKSRMDGWFVQGVYVFIAEVLVLVASDGN